MATSFLRGARRARSGSRWQHRLTWRGKDLKICAFRRSAFAHFIWRRPFRSCFLGFRCPYFARAAWREDESACLRSVILRCTPKARLEGRRPGRLSSILRGSLRSHLRMTESKLASACLRKKGSHHAQTHRPRVSGKDATRSRGDTCSAATTSSRALHQRAEAWPDLAVTTPSR